MQNNRRFIVAEILFAKLIAEHISWLRVETCSFEWVKSAFQIKLLFDFENQKSFGFMGMQKGRNKNLNTAHYGFAFKW